MGKKDPRIDQYIAKAGDFAKPILTHLRALVHEAVPGVEEDLKWGSPSFMYKGVLCGMASFKSHCAFGLWKHDLVVAAARSGDAMGSFGRITSLKDLPSDKTLIAYVRKGAKLNDEGVKMPRRPAGPAKPLKAPPYLVAALKKNARASKAFEGFSTSKRNEYVEWVTEAKTDATRDKRLKTAIEWIAEGKGRNWKYEKC